MGVVLGVEAVEGIAAAAEGAEAVEGITSAAEAEEAISSGSEAGAEAGSGAGEDAAAAAQSGGDALESALQTLNKALAKLNKMVTEYMAIDAVFKVAKKILRALFSDPTAQARAKKLEKLINVLSQSSNLLKDLTDWLKAHSQDNIDIKDITVTMQGVLSKFVPQLGAAARTLTTLSNQISKKNVKKEPVTDGEINAIEHSLQTVLNSFKSLAEFKAQHKDKVRQLGGLPIDEKKVASMQAEMP